MFKFKALNEEPSASENIEPLKDHYNNDESGFISLAGLDNSSIPESH